MMKSKFIPVVTAMVVATTGCSTSKPQTAPSVSPDASAGDTAVVLKWGNNATGSQSTHRPPAAVAKARVYKTNGDYSDRVTVTLNASRTSLVSFPSPGDLRGGEPLKLDGGFLLDRRGVGPHTAFTRWTYSEYAALTAAPSPREIMDNLLPDACVTEIYEMPFSASDPDAESRSNALIAAGFPDCKRVK